MKITISKISLAVALSMSFIGCAKFDEINTDPTAANKDQVQVEYFINNSIISAQQDPHIAERVFVIYWKTAARQHFTTGIAGGSDDDDYSNDYWRYISEWLNHANTAIEIADYKQEANTAKEYNNNLIQVARIWRAYLMSEMSDNFGPIPVEAFQGVNPEISTTKDVYYYLLAELTDAAGKIDESISTDDKLKDLDPAYKYDWDKWIRYANSMRMRLSMRLSEVDPGKAKEEFEAAVLTKRFIENADQNFQVAEKPGWDALAGVMSREWNSQLLSATLNNLYIGLGGVKSSDQLGATLQKAIKPADYIGVKYEKHFTDMTNDPSAGYWLDGLPNKIDPRAYKTFFIPGDFSNADYSYYPSYTSDAKTNRGNLIVAAGDTIKVSTVNTWNAFAVGDWGEKGTRNFLKGYVGRSPGLVQKFRGSQNQRIFFANWESYFLIAEAALRGWNTPMSDEQAYNKAVEASFDYAGVGQFVSEYLNSESYNRVGTSAKYGHTVEPSATVTMKYSNGYAAGSGTVNIAYPKNTIYKNGAVKNDKLTKIITQKYIANMPWVPLESWNDHRRLGLPFFENPAVENPLTNLPALTSSNYKTNAVDFFPQRLRYPSNFRKSDAVGYAKGVEYLGGKDDVFSPLWWAKQK